MDVRNICIMEKKLKFYNLTGGCHTPLTHALLIEPNQQFYFPFPMKLLVFCVEATEKKLPALGGWLVSRHISIQGIKSELQAGALPFCYPQPHDYVLFYRNSKNITFRTVNVLAFHKILRLKDSCSNSDCFRDSARY